MCKGRRTTESIHKLMLHRNGCVHDYRQLKIQVYRLGPAFTERMRALSSIREGLVSKVVTQEARSNADRYPKPAIHLQICSTARMQIYDDITLSFISLSISTFCAMNANAVANLENKHKWSPRSYKFTLHLNWLLCSRSPPIYLGSPARPLASH